MMECSLIKLWALRTATLLKETSTHVFPCKNCEIFKNTLLYKHLQWLLLTVSDFQPATLLKKILQQSYISVNFAKLLRIFFDRTPPDDCFLCLSVNLGRFSEHLFYRAPLRNCLFHVQVVQI